MEEGPERRAATRSWLAAAALLVLAWPSPGSAATQSVTAQATIVKPLILEWRQNLDLGSITIGPGTWSSSTVSLSRTGTLSCGANLTCVGPTQVARYNVSGTNNRVVQIRAPNVTLVNQADSTRTLTLVTDAPATLTLTNSGPPGTDFQIGGSITLNPTTAGGTYVGTFNVTVDYQ